MHRTAKFACAAFAVLAIAISGSARALAADDVLQKIKERGTMRVCDLSYPPWNVKNPVTNEWEGINVDLAAEIAKTLAVKVEHVDTDWATILQSINTGKCDFGISTLWVSAARAQVATFTNPIGVEGMTLFVSTSSPAQTFEDLDQPGKVIAAPTGTPNEKWDQEHFKKATSKSIVGDAMAAALMEVAAGRADAANGGYYGNLAFIKANPNLKLRPLKDVLFDPTPLAWAVPAREYFLRDYLNLMLADMERTGVKQKIIDKWTKSGE